MQVWLAWSSCKPGCSQTHKTHLPWNARSQGYHHTQWFIVLHCTFSFLYSPFALLRVRVGWLHSRVPHEGENGPEPSCQICPRRLHGDGVFSFHHYLETQLGSVSKALFTGCCYDVSCLCDGNLDGSLVLGISGRYFPSFLIPFQVQRRSCGTPPLEELSLDKSKRVRNICTDSSKIS